MNLELKNFKLFPDQLPFKMFEELDQIIGQLNFIRIENNWPLELNHLNRINQMMQMGKVTGPMTELQSLYYVQD